VTAFEDEVKDRFGVEPICRVLAEHGVKIAPSTYYAAKARPASARTLRDQAVLVEIKRLYATGSRAAACPGSARCGTCCAARGAWTPARASSPCLAVRSSA